MNSNQKLAKAFFDSLFPHGEHCILHNTTRTFLEGCIQETFERYFYDDKRAMEEFGQKQKALAAVLRKIADGLDPQ